MIRKLYKYTGGISSFSYRRNSPEAVPSVDMILYDINDDDKAPIRISAAGGLADYINAIEWTDAEERYLSSDWYFDNLLYLHRIEVPSTEPGKPAKIIAQHDAIDRCDFRIIATDRHDDVIAGHPDAVGGVEPHPAAHRPAPQ